MKLIKIPLILIILFVCFRICFGQEKLEPILFEELKDEYCSEILALKLDYFILELNKYPTSKGYVLFYGKKNSQEGKNLLYLKHPQRYLTGFRGFQKDRIVTIPRENKDKMIMQLWIVPNGAEFPTISKSFVKEEIDSTTLFDRSWADWYKWNGSEWTISVIVLLNGAVKWI